MSLSYLIVGNIQSIGFSIAFNYQHINTISANRFVDKMELMKQYDPLYTNNNVLI